MACGRCGGRTTAQQQPQRRPSNTVGGVVVPAIKPLGSSPGVSPVRDAISRLRYVPK